MEMATIQFHMLTASDTEAIKMIADWYEHEWNISREMSRETIWQAITDEEQFQVLLAVDGRAVGTAGVYRKVSIVEKVPELSRYRNWLALVYTIPDCRGQGWGELICNYAQEHSKEMGIKDLYLFTDTAERLYGRLGWTVLERLTVGSRNIVVMTKRL
jgi:N-acetylglutamate synthase-like GNAT family acetyltransferase